MGFTIHSASLPTIPTTNIIFMSWNVQTCLLHPKDLATCSSKRYMAIRTLYWGGFSDLDTVVETIQQWLPSKCTSKNPAVFQSSSLDWWLVFSIFWKAQDISSNTWEGSKWLANKSKEAEWHTSYMYIKQASKRRYRPDLGCTYSSPKIWYDGVPSYFKGPKQK